jgi:hypothetical protein
MEVGLEMGIYAVCVVPGLCKDIYYNLQVNTYELTDLSDEALS